MACNRIKSQCASRYQPSFPLKSTVLVFCQAFCKLSKSLFRQFPIYIVFCDPPPLKIGEPPYYYFSSLTAFYLLKVTKFLVKICQFKFLVMADKHFGLYFFCCLKFPILVYFLCNNCDPSLPLLKSHPLFCSNFPLKIEILPCSLF